MVAWFVYCRVQLVMIKPKWKFISIWNLLDIAIISLFAYEFYLIHGHINVVNPSLDAVRRVKKNAYYECYPLAAHVKHEEMIAGILVVTSWVKVGIIRYLVKLTSS